MSLQPNIGINGAQVIDLDRQYPSQSLSASQRLPLSLVSLMQVSAPDFPAFPHRPPCLTQAVSAAVMTRGGATTTAAAGSATGGLAFGFDAAGLAGSPAIGGSAGLGFGRGAAAVPGGAASKVVTVIAPPVIGLSAETRGLPALPAPTATQAVKISTISNGKKRITLPICFAITRPDRGAARKAF